MKTIMKMFGYVLIATFCLTAVGAAAYYVFDPQNTKGAKSAANKSSEGGKEGQDDHAGSRGQRGEEPRLASGQCGVPMNQEVRWR